MKRTYSFVLTSRVVGALLVVAAYPSSAETGSPTSRASPRPPQVVPVTVTNWVSRFITNIIEIRMPTNRFMDEYHTNWVDQFTTNVIYVYRTNQVTRARTNEIVLERVETHEVPAYQTNVIHAYQTNWKTLTLTNWENVVVMKTNWVRQPITNVVEMNLPATALAAGAGQLPRAATPSFAGVGKNESVARPAPPADGTQDLIVELSCMPASTGATQMEVQMVLKSVRDPVAVLPVQEWRVERSDNAVLMLGQRPEFKGQLPPGSYKITTKVRLGEQTSLLTLRGVVEVTSLAGSKHIPVTAVTSRR